MNFNSVVLSGFLLFLVFCAALTGLLFLKVVVFFFVFDSGVFYMIFMTVMMCRFFRSSWFLFVFKVFFMADFKGFFLVFFSVFLFFVCNKLVSSDFNGFSMVKGKVRVIIFKISVTMMEDVKWVSGICFGGVGIFFSVRLIFEGFVFSSSGFSFWLWSFIFVSNYSFFRKCIFFVFLNWFYNLFCYL